MILNFCNELELTVFFVSYTVIVNINRMVAGPCVGRNIGTFFHVFNIPHVLFFSRGKSPSSLANTASRTNNTINLLDHIRDILSVGGGNSCRTSCRRCSDKIDLVRLKKTNEQIGDTTDQNHNSYTFVGLL